MIKCWLLGILLEFSIFTIPVVLVCALFGLVWALCWACEKWVDRFPDVGTTFYHVFKWLFIVSVLFLISWTTYESKQSVCMRGYGGAWHEFWSTQARRGAK